jgi:hypothetical protein
LALSLALIVGGYYWATGTMDGIYAYRSPLQAQPPAPALSAGPALTRRVVLVLVDGLREDTAQNAEVMPVLAAIRDGGASARMHSRPLSFSQPGYATLLTGAWPDLNDGPAVNLDGDKIPTITQDTLFSAAQRAGLSTAISGYDWFEKLVRPEAVTFHFYTPGEDAAADRQVVDAALPWLRAGQGQLVLIHLDQVDYAGHHEGGPRDPRWDAAAARCDALLGEILSAIDLSQDTLLVVSDHGHIDQGGHGGTEAVTLVEPFVLVGNGVRPGQYDDVQMVDVAPTLAALLGANLPASAQGRPLLDMLSIDAAQRAALDAAFQAQQARLADDYRQAIGMLPPAWADASPGAEGIARAQAARLARERWPRAMMAVLIALALGRLVFGSLPRWGLRLLAGLIFLQVFILGFGLVSAKNISLSSFSGVEDLLLTAGGWTLAAALISGMFIAWRAGLSARRPAELCARLLGMLATAAWLLLLPILIGFALNGYQPVWILPEFVSAFLSLLSAVVLLICGLLGALLALGGLLARS